MTTPKVTWPDPQAYAPVIGDDLFDRFILLLEAEGEAEGYDVDNRDVIIARFVAWLIDTPDGALALRRIKDFPKQHALEFPDDLRPWRT